MNPRNRHGLGGGAFTFSFGPERVPAVKPLSGPAVPLSPTRLPDDLEVARLRALLREIRAMALAFGQEGIAEKCGEGLE